MTHLDIFPVDEIYLTMYPVKYKQAESGTVRLSPRDNHLGEEMVITLTAKVWWVRL